MLQKPAGVSRSQQESHVKIWPVSRSHKCEGGFTNTCECSVDDQSVMTVTWQLLRSKRRRTNWMKLFVCFFLFLYLCVGVYLCVCVFLCVFVYLCVCVFLGVGVTAQRAARWSWSASTAFLQPETKIFTFFKWICCRKNCLWSVYTNSMRRRKSCHRSFSIID